MKVGSRLWIGVVVGLFLVLGLLAGTKASQVGTMMKAGAAMKPPPVAVASARVKRISWERVEGAVGSLLAVRGVTLGSELPGLVRAIEFESGSSVRRGMVLVRLDTSAEEAQLAAARADSELAAVNLQRATALRAADANAPADLDAARARASQAAAAAATLEAIIAKKVIRAPFDGRISIRQVELGQFLAAGAPIASLQSVSPIHAEFWLPQQTLSELTVGQRTRLTVDTFPGVSWEGTVTTINPEVDVATRNVRVRATVENPDGRLRPGMFARVEVVGHEHRTALVIPATAPIFAPFGDSVFVVDEQAAAPDRRASVVRQQFVRLGERRGDFVEVLSGLDEGARIVSAGAFKLRSGMAVALNDSLAPDARLAPTPTDR
ncbi:MAG TPA: efflux RND transporter periplasmic adaptor subunit [Anaeromyxobacteraceae bacterium]|nr:efflux RND transporter periplasmic adaptor subunit [Anaeromyxobacteraceae bacterium]